MKFLIVGLKKNPQLLRLQEEGKKRGHQVDGCLAADIVIRAETDSFQVELKRGGRINEYDLIYLWAIGQRRWEWLMAADYLNQQHQVKIVNHKLISPGYQYYLTPASEYYKQTMANIRYPKSVVFFPGKGVKELVKNLGLPLIVKVSASRQGRGIYKIETWDQFEKMITDQQDEKTVLIAREYIPNDGDIRIFTVGYKAVGAMKRTPKKGDFRSNISQGGKGNVFDLKRYPKVRQISEKLSRLTQTEIAGVDIMLHKESKLPYVLEINPGPQFLGLEKYTKTNAAFQIIKYFEDKI
ncbi:RimK family alpha-L-glutamate ligase [Patescibacteria group bacterium]